MQQLAYYLGVQYTDTNDKNALYERIITSPEYISNGHASSVKALGTLYGMKIDPHTKKEDVFNKIYNGKDYIPQDRNIYPDQYDSQYINQILSVHPTDPLLTYTPPDIPTKFKSKDLKTACLSGIHGDFKKLVIDGTKKYGNLTGVVKEKSWNTPEEYYKEIITNPEKDLSVYGNDIGIQRRNMEREYEYSINKVPEEQRTYEHAYSAEQHQYAKNIINARLPTLNFQQDPPETPDVLAPQIRKTGDSYIYVPNAEEIARKASKKPRKKRTTKKK